MIALCLWWVRTASTVADPPGYAGTTPAELVVERAGSGIASSGISSPTNEGFETSKSQRPYAQHAPHSKRLLDRATAASVLLDERIKARDRQMGIGAADIVSHQADTNKVDPSANGFMLVSGSARGEGYDGNAVDMKTLENQLTDAVAAAEYKLRNMVDEHAIQPDHRRRMQNTSSSCTQASCRNGGVCHSGSCACALGWNGTTCDNDVNECDSMPCQNRAICSDSTNITNSGGDGSWDQFATIGIHVYQCTCMAGFANGVCEYDFISEYAAQCSVQESD
eukprot:COSAG01_NODE_11824_length_1852_cov_1.411865_1_plen_279_part_10